MKKILLSLLFVLLAAWLFLAFVGVEPLDRRPGTLLGGEPTALPADWSFLNDDLASEVHIETRPWYGVPFSVTTVIAEANGVAYLPSLYDAVMPFPGTKYWNKVVQADPDVRLRVDGNLYELAIYPITDAEEFDVAFRALGRKYPFWATKVAENETPHQFVLLRLVPRAG